MNTGTQTAMTQGLEMQRQLIEKAGKDMEFRALLVADPKAAIRNEYGIGVPDGINIQVHESDITNIHISLPLSPNVELDEERLEAIAAGLSCCL